MCGIVDGLSRLGMVIEALACDEGMIMGGVACSMYSWSRRSAYYSLCRVSRHALLSSSMRRHSLLRSVRIFAHVDTESIL